MSKTSRKLSREALEDRLELRRGSRTSRHILADRKGTRSSRNNDAKRESVDA